MTLDVLLNEIEIQQCIHQLVQSIKPMVSGGNVVIIGIDLKGTLIAKRLVNTLKKELGITCLLGSLDTSLYQEKGTTDYINVGKTDIPFSLKNKRVLLVTESLMTGESINAALGALSDYDSPDDIKACALIYQNKLRYPILAEFVGKIVKEDLKGDIQIHLLEVDGEDKVFKTLKQSV